MTKGSTRTIAGFPAIGVVDKGADGGTLYVATTGQPVPLALQAKSDNLTFGDYGTPVTVEAPPAAQVIDAATLPGS